MTPRRGDIWLADLGEPVGREQGGRRPALVISNDQMNEGPMALAIVVPITKASRGLPIHIEIESNGSGLDETSYAKCEDVKSISTERLIHRFGQVGSAEMFSVENALRILLEL